MYDDGHIINCNVTSTDVKTSEFYSDAGGVTGENAGSVAKCTVKECTIAGGGSTGGVIGYNRGNNTNNTYVGTLNQVGAS